jgi:hypothetical protein
MPVRLFSLRGVPDDEAEDVRALLTENNIDFYETSPGNWGISTPGIWLRDESQLHQARALIKGYQQERADEQRKIYEQLRQEGKQRTFLTVFVEDPLKIIAYIAIVGLILYFSTKPFLNLGK